MASDVPIYLWIPLVAGGVGALVVVIGGGVGAYEKSRGKCIPPKKEPQSADDRSSEARMGVWHWLRTEINAGSAWAPQDSWATNAAGVGAILGAVVSATAGPIGQLVSGRAVVAITILFLLFGVATALGPITYAVFGSSYPVPSASGQDTVGAVGGTVGTVGGFLAAAFVVLVAVFGELAAVAYFVYQTTNSGAGQVAAIVFGFVSAVLVAAYSVRAAVLDATILPAPAADAAALSPEAAAGRAALLPSEEQPLLDPAPPVRERLFGTAAASLPPMRASLLGHAGAGRSATL
jgi:hypothetical protein